MKWQNLFSGRNKNNISMSSAENFTYSASICRLRKILPSVLSRNRLTAFFQGQLILEHSSYILVSCYKTDVF